jgi:hypothetical protein
MAVVGVLVATMTLGACATNPDGTTPNVFSDLGTAFGAEDPNLTPEQRALREQHEDYAEVRLTSTAVGVGAGALIGAGLGALIGGRDGALLGAGIGAGVGGLAGYGAGTYLTRDHQDFTATRDTLQRDITQAREETAKARRSADIAQSNVTAQQRQLNALNADLRAGRITEAEARRKVAAAREDARLTGELAAASEQRVAKLNESIAAHRAANLPTGELAQETNRMKAQADRLRELERAQLNAINRVPANLRAA